eukprot:TRINITY_DN169_c0_g1_i5.p1 TRINITY_DN169_c0_g1~~TRINITY_DN169_c0_g1_i5.p1  ORF type:complete len:329 (+),score=135.13 TRINITY_DN169_c0_g1_i5:45-1031(+)
MFFGLEIVIPLAVAGAASGGVALYQKKKYDDRQKAKTFKKSLGSMETCHFEKCQVPTILNKIIARINPDGLKEEKIFGIQGNLDSVHRLRKLFNTQKEKKICIDMEPFEDIASLLRLWLRQLPEAIIPIQTSTSLLEVYKGDKTGELDAYKEALLQLPERHYECLRVLLYTLHETWKYCAVRSKPTLDTMWSIIHFICLFQINQMESSDLSHQFGPFIIHDGLEKRVLTEEEKKAKEEEKKEAEKKKKEEEKKMSKEEKASGKEKKRQQEIQAINEILRLQETKYDNKQDIIPILQILIENAPDLFVEAKSSMKKGKKSKTPSGYSRR